MDLSINHIIFPLASSILANMKLSNSVFVSSTLIVPIIRAANSMVQVSNVSGASKYAKNHTPETSKIENKAKSDEKTHDRHRGGIQSW